MKNGKVSLASQEYLVCVCVCVFSVFRLCHDETNEFIIENDLWFTDNAAKD